MQKWSERLRRRERPRDRGRSWREEVTVSIMHEKKKKRKEARETSAVKVGAIQPGMLSGHKFCQSLAEFV